MIVPCAVWRPDDVAAFAFAALTLDIGVSARIGENSPASIGAVNMRRHPVAWNINRDRDAHRGGNL